MYQNQEYIMKRNKIKSKRKQHQKRMIFVFFSTFIGVFLLSMWVANILTPDIDIPVLEKETKAQNYISSNDFKGRIDSRLKLLEEQDETGYFKKKREEQERELHASLNENVEAEKEIEAEVQDNLLAQPINPVDETIPPPQIKLEPPKIELSNNQQTQNNLGFENPLSPPEYQDIPVPIANMPQDSLKPVKPALRTKKEYNSQTTVMYKVLVGKFNTPREARQESYVIANKPYNISPFIKYFEGKYSVQVGSFADIDKAKTMASVFSDEYDVRIIKD